MGSEANMNPKCCQEVSKHNEGGDGIVDRMYVMSIGLPLPQDPANRGAARDKDN